MYRHRHCLFPMQHSTPRITKPARATVAPIEYLMFFALLFTLWKVWANGTYTQPLKWKNWWALAQKKAFGNRLSQHDMAVIESMAENLNITPDRVMLTIFYDPRTPNDSHMEYHSDEEQARFGRINHIQSQCELFHRGVAYRILNGGYGAYWQLVAGTFTAKNTKTLDELKKLPNPNNYEARMNTEIKNSFRASFFDFCNSNLLQLM